MNSSLARAVFLDRDGVLNEAIIRNGKPFSPANAEETIIVPGARDLMQSLRQRGFRLIVVTNQPDIARGKIAESTVDRINRLLCQAMPLDAVEVCAHDDADNCDCRKPKPGMLVRAARREGIALGSSFMVGDRWRDIEAGHRAGCRTVLIGDGYGEKQTSTPDVTVPDLKGAVDWILTQSDGTRIPL